MRVGFLMLCHDGLDRAAQVAGYWADRGCPVVIHVDRRVSREAYDTLVAALEGRHNIRFSERFRCEWGRWSLVAATLAAARVMIDEFPTASHVFLASGSCLPLRHISQLRAYLAERPGVNFIESVTTEDVPWTKGGLDHERFALRFPFSWKRQRKLFDLSVRLQRRLGYRRRIPKGLVPHMGSQWWCLTRGTLQAILDHPRRAEFDRFFKGVWIPDESYFQSLVRLCTDRVESRSLTLAKFDYQGKPHIFYDDHLQLLRRSDCFVARKIWPRADRLYATFLSDRTATESRAEPNPGKIDRIFSKAIERRTRGRAGLYMTGRFPRVQTDAGRTCARYVVFEGFGDLFEDFPAWAARTTGLRAHGHLFGPERAEFADGQSVFSGALSDSATLRDYNAVAFLTNLIWNTRGERQSFLYGPRDTVAAGDFFPYDLNADVFAITGAWAIPLYLSGRPVIEIRKQAAELQRIEGKHLDHLRSRWAKARVHVWTLADFIESPVEPLQTMIDEIGNKAGLRLTEAPRMRDLTGFGQFLQDLRNEGMQPWLVGDLRTGDSAPDRPARPKPYAVR
ncbi:glycosyl transferase [Palleronia sediminis]|uniref:Peptide O-xylosyltransferase n=1 Tax=Palleronia sediminis TaxID=2547833 RepID=A0A4R6A7L9_9RHOB|nr:beta-1,6-N-acetylglucosaminyltransferase [Palleronia sediminis]TDL78188.1 glycosyl transferase [Palleronia sediminis]